MYPSKDQLHSGSAELDVIRRAPMTAARGETCMGKKAGAKQENC